MGKEGGVGRWWVGLRAMGKRGGGRTYLSLIWGPIRSVLIGLSVTFRMVELLLAVKQRGGGRGCLCLHRFRFWRSLDGRCITVRVLVFFRAAPLLCCFTVCSWKSIVIDVISAVCLEGTSQTSTGPHLCLLMTALGPCLFPCLSPCLCCGCGGGEICALSCVTSSCHDCGSAAFCPSAHGYASSLCPCPFPCPCPCPGS